MSNPALGLRAGGRLAGRAAGDVATVLAVRMLLALLGAIAALFGAVLLYRHSISGALWGPYLPNSPKVTIVRYSTPWIDGAAGLTLLAGLLVTAVVADLVRWRRVRRVTHDHLGH